MSSSRTAGGQRGSDRRRDHLEAAGRAAFPTFKLRTLVRTASTQDVVATAARSGAEAGWCCISAEQTAGRGRQGRTWTAPRGTALLASILIRPSPPAAAGIPLAAGIAVVDALSSGWGVAARLRWPNDVLAGRGKLAGILAEVEPRAPGPGPAVVLGLGVNLSVAAFPEGVAGESLHHLLAPAEPPLAEELLALVLPHLADRLGQLERGGVPAIRPDWRERALGLGGPIIAETPQGKLRGTAIDIDESGALLVSGPGGTARLVAGDVHLVAES
jgi:BirA family biotin operon repressor/biotin-[acetyl-CoA-carboxylase] ligase